MNKTNKNKLMNEAKNKNEKKIEKELLLMVRKLLLQVLIGWAKPLYQLSS